MQSVKNLVIGLALVVITFGGLKVMNYQQEVRNLGGVENYKAMQEWLGSKEYTQYQRAVLQMQVQQVATALYGTGK